jgi:hypothetical protein
MFNVVSFDSIHNILFVSNSARNSIFVSRLNIEAGGFDYLVEYSINQPILSSVSVKSSSHLIVRNDDALEAEYIGLLAVQTKSVQVYFEKLEKVFPKISKKTHESTKSPIVESLLSPSMITKKKTKKEKSDKGDYGTFDKESPKSAKSEFSPISPLDIVFDKKVKKEEKETPGTTSYASPTTSRVTPNDPLERAMDRLYDRLMKERKEHERLELQRQDAFLKTVTQTLNKNLTVLLESVVHNEIQKVVLPALNKTVEKTLTKAVQDSVKSSLSESINSGVSNLNFSEAIESSTRKTLEDRLIPAYQAATKSMGQQIIDSLNKSVSSKGNIQNSVLKAIDNLSRLVQTENENLIKTLSTVLKHEVKAEAAEQQQGGETATTEREIKELVSQKDYEQAFVKVRGEEKNYQGVKFI